MKHLSKLPDAASAKRADVPPDLDLVVTRALAKDQEDRYASAEEMDADLARVARGQHVSPETQEAATMIISSPPTDVTMVSRAPTVAQPRRTFVPPEPVYYDYDEPVVRRRPFWPWLLALLIVVVAGIVGWYADNQIQDQLNASKPVAVDDYRGLREPAAVSQITASGLRAHVRRTPSDKQPETFVFDQSPNPGDRIGKGNYVTILVSSGKPKTTVPDVRGSQATDATAALVQAHLKPEVHQVNNDKPSGTVIAQDPKPGEKVVQGTKVRINVSEGPKPIGVPPVVGENVASASSALQGAGFQVTGVARYGNDSFVCRIDGEPKPADEACIDTPPATYYWSYWYARNGGTGTFSTVELGTMIVSSPSSR